MSKLLILGGCTMLMVASGMIYYKIERIEKQLSIVQDGINTKINDIGKDIRSRTTALAMQSQTNKLDSTSLNEIKKIVEGINANSMPQVSDSDNTKVSYNEVLEKIDSVLDMSENIAYQISRTDKLISDLNDLKIQLENDIKKVNEDFIDIKTHQKEILNYSEINSELLSKSFRFLKEENDYRQKMRRR